MADTKIRFSVEGVQMIEEAMGRIHQQTENLTDTWIKGGSIIIEDLQEQIRLLEQRNDLGKKTLGEGFKKNVSETNDLISAQIRLLRSRNEAARGGFRNEASSDSDNNTSTQGEEVGVDYGQGLNGNIKLSEAITIISDSLETLLTEGIKIHPETMEYVAELLETSSESGIAPGRRAGSRDGGGEESRRSDANGAEGGLSEFLQKLAVTNLFKGIDMAHASGIPRQFIDNSSNALMQMGGKLGMIGAVVGLASQAINAKRDWIAQHVETGAIQRAQMAGQDWRDFTVAERETTLKYGVLQDDVNRRYIQMAKSSGGNASTTDVQASFAFEKTYGIDPSVYSALVRSNMNDKGLSYMEMQGFVGGLERSLGDRKARAFMSDYAQLFVSELSRQTATIGSAYGQGISGLISQVAGIKGISPEMASTAVTGLREGLSNPKNAQVEAMQNSILMQINPNASYYDLLKMKEDPFSKDNIEYLPKMLEAMRQRSGGNTEDFAYSISQMFLGGKNFALAEKLANSDLSDIDSFKKAIENAKGDAEELRYIDSEENINKYRSKRSQVEAQDEINLLQTRYKEDLDNINGAVSEIAGVVKEGLGNIGNSIVEAIGKGFGAVANKQ